MYKQEELLEITKRLRKRWWVTCVPCALMLTAAIVIFVYGQQQRSETLWMLTAGLTILGGALFLFLYGVYVRPMRLYRRHVDTMLNGRRRETTGVFKSFSDEVSDQEGLECHPMFINVGDKDEDKDDRLFYYDVFKDKPAIPLGTRVTVTSNDKMVADIKPA